MFSILQYIDEILKKVTEWSSGWHSPLSLGASLEVVCRDFNWWRLMGRCTASEKNRLWGKRKWFFVVNIVDFFPARLWKYCGDQTDWSLANIHGISGLFSPPSLDFIFIHKQQRTHCPHQDFPTLKTKRFLLVPFHTNRHMSPCCLQHTLAYTAKHEPGGIITSLLKV